mgnify:CR=1 FL=1
MQNLQIKYITATNKVAFITLLSGHSFLQTRRYFKLFWNGKPVLAIRKNRFYGIVNKQPIALTRSLF